MADYQITCINKPNRNSPHEHITQIGGSWGKITSNDAIAHIDAGTHRFYTKSNGTIAWVGVVRDAGKRPYLRTHADGYYNDNLLALADCS